MNIHETNATLLARNNDHPEIECNGWQWSNKLAAALRETDDALKVAEDALEQAALEIIEIESAAISQEPKEDL